MDKTKKWQIFNQPLIFFIIFVCVCVCVRVRARARVCVCEGDGLMLGRLSTVEVRKQSKILHFPGNCCICHCLISGEKVLSFRESLIY